jgi:hypothetical protein
VSTQASKVLGAVKDGGLLLGVVLCVPVAIIVIGAPIALLVRLVIELLS